MDASRLALLEASLVHLGVNEVEAAPIYFRQYGFFHYLDICDLTTIGLISSSETGPLVAVFCKGTILPMFRYSGTVPSLRASMISSATLLLRCSLAFSTFPSKQSGPSPLLKLEHYIASISSARLKVVDRDSIYISNSLLAPFIKFDLNFL